MPKQMTFASLAHASQKKVTRREKFLAEMEAVVAWSRLLALIEPHCPKMGHEGHRPAMPLEVMLRIYCLQQWYALSDPMAEESPLSYDFSWLLRQKRTTARHAIYGGQWRGSDREKLGRFW